MLIPSSLKVGAITYKVELAPASQMSKDLGETDFDKSLIRLNKEVDIQQIEAAFIHEIIHTINTQLPEETVDFIALSLLQVLKDNNLLNEGSQKKKST